MSSAATAKRPSPYLSAQDEAFILDVLRAFLHRVGFKQVAPADNPELETAVEREIVSWDLDEEAEGRVRAAVSPAISICELCYYHHQFEEKLILTLITTLLFCIDNNAHLNVQAMGRYSDRLLSGQQQDEPTLQCLVKVLAKVSDYWEPFSASAMVLAACGYVAGTTLEQRLLKGQLQYHEAAFDFPWMIRVLTGSAPTYSYGCFPKAEHPDLKRYIQAIPDIDIVINKGNDVLSFYKEELIGEHHNYIHTYARVHRKNPREVLTQLADETVIAWEKACKILAGDPVALKAWQTFMWGYMAFNLQHDRYMLAKHFVGEFLE